MLPSLAYSSPLTQHKTDGSIRQADQYASPLKKTRDGRTVEPGIAARGCSRAVRRDRTAVRPAGSISSDTLLRNCYERWMSYLTKIIKWQEMYLFSQSHKKIYTE
jgi:hypothetical protein